jgi:hypothetical protein
MRANKEGANKIKFYLLWYNMTIFVKKTYVAETILEQLGGRQFLLLTGSKNLVKDDIRKSLTMKLTSNKSTILNSDIM